MRKRSRRMFHVHGCERDLNASLLVDYRVEPMEYPERSTNVVPILCGCLARVSSRENESSCLFRGLFLYCS